MVNLLLVRNLDKLASFLLLPFCSGDFFRFGQFFNDHFIHRPFLLDGCEYNFFSSTILSRMDGGVL